jgi:hypothetical protein
MRAALVALVGFAALASCAGRSETYEQTWREPYSETTCAEWTSTMTDDQQFAASADLVWEHHEEQGATERPKTGPIVDYQGLMTQECAAKPDKTIAQVARRIHFAD